MIEECQEHVDAFDARGHPAAKRWMRVIMRLRSTGPGGDVTDKALAEWLAASRRHGWADGEETLPKVLVELEIAEA